MGKKKTPKHGTRRSTGRTVGKRTSGPKWGKVGAPHSNKRKAWCRKMAKRK